MVFRLTFALLFLSSSARAADLVLGGPIDRVVVAGDLVAASRGPEVRVISSDGRPLLHLGAPPPEERPSGARASGEDALEFYGVPEEDEDDDYAEELVDDELTMRERRGSGRREPALEPVTPLLAASESELWIIAGRTLWRVEPDGRARPALALPQVFRALAASDEDVVAAAGARVWRSPDGGGTFELAAEAAGPVRAVAASGGRLAWATSRELTMQDGATSITVPLPGRTRDLRFCGRALLALHERGLVIVDEDGHPHTLSIGAERARRLSCARGLWVLSSPRLLVSTDGRTFAERGDFPGNATDAAVGRHCLWVGTSAGLFCLPPRPGARTAIAALPEELTSTGQRSDRARWTSFLPRVALAATANTWAGHQDLRAVAYADFPLGVPRTRALPPPRLVAQVEAAPEVPVPSAVPLPPDREASCLPVVRAEAVARALVEPERARSYLSRAANAAWLPELRVRFDRRLGRSESLDLPSGGTVAAGPLGLDTANDVRYEARATWDLAKLVFSNEEIAAATTALRMADMRREVESLANRLYFERRRLKMEMVLAPNADPRARRDLRIQELDAELDALSGGAFTRCLPAPP
jgi:hypothetical protein